MRGFAVPYFGKDAELDCLGQPWGTPCALPCDAIVNVFLLYSGSFYINLRQISKKITNKEPVILEKCPSGSFKRFKIENISFV